MQKIDPYNSRDKLDRWKKREIAGISPKNAQLIRDYIHDMERGINTNGNIKGSRSAVKLLSLASRLKKIAEMYEKKFNKHDLTKATFQQVHDLFLDMQDGTINKATGEKYMDVGDYIKRFKSFWHWYMKREAKQNHVVVDITNELAVKVKHKPAFVYFTKEQLEKLMDAERYDMKVLMIFLFDTGMRAPTELLNIRVCDFQNDFKELNIRSETTKNNYGRRIKLMMASEAIKKFIKDNSLKDDDLVFSFNPATVNKRLKAVGKKVLGDKVTLGRSRGSELTMYDFRHSAGCYWLLRYKSEMSLMYRFAWKDRGMIDYYTELLGMKDTITEDDMLLGIDKSELEKKISEQAEQINVLRQEMVKVAELVAKKLNKKIK